MFNTFAWQAKGRWFNSTNPLWGCVRRLKSNMPNRRSGDPLWLQLLIKRLDFQLGHKLIAVFTGGGVAPCWTAKSAGFLWIYLIHFAELKLHLPSVTE